jgi:adenylate cyclase
MASEIERKYLVSSDRWQAAVVSRHRLVDGIGSFGNGKVRIRMDEERAWVAFKGPRAGITRSEYEYPIPRRDAEEMLDSLSPPQIVVKVRHMVKAGGMLWAVDVHEEPFFGLVTAEVELHNENEIVELPPWVGMEVTGSAARLTSKLAAWAQAR